MSLIEHAKREFSVLGWPGDCKMQEAICNGVLELLQVFSEQGHSGSSAPYALHLFNELARFNPVSPLTGEDSEWQEVGEGIYQNVRDGSVFKDGSGAYWIDGKIFRDKNGCTYTNKDSRVPVVFPWVKPAPIIIDRDEG